MQLQGFLLMLFIFLIAPIFLISTNHNVFFVLVAFILFFHSFRTIIGLFLGTQENPDTSEEDETKEDLEEIFNFDIKKFGVGAKVVKNLIFVLFFIYCLFYLKHFWLKILVAAIICSWSLNIMNSITDNESVEIHHGIISLKGLYIFSINAATLVVLAMVSYNKFINILF